MTDPLLGHGRRDLLDRVITRTGDHRGRHDVSDGAAQQRVAAVVELPDDVSFGHDADDGLTPCDHQRAHVSSDVEQDRALPGERVLGLCGRGHDAFVFPGTVW